MAHIMTATDRGVYELATPVYQSYQLLHVAYVLAPIIAGLDKFFNALTQWTMYLAPIIPQTLGITPSTFMFIVGIVEIIAAVVVALRPKIGAYIVAVWLWGIIINLIIAGGYYDIALRDFGLSLGALALARLSVYFEKPTVVTAP